MIPTTIARKNRVRSWWHTRTVLTLTSSLQLDDLAFLVWPSWTWKQFRRRMDLWSLLCTVRRDTLITTWALRVTTLWYISLVLYAWCITEQGVWWQKRLIKRSRRSTSGGHWIGVIILIGQSTWSQTTNPEKDTNKDRGTGEKRPVGIPYGHGVSEKTEKDLQAV